MQEKLDELYTAVLVGNGHPSLRSQVARHDDWINSANRLIWILVTAFVGQSLIMVCAFLVWIVTFLGQSGIFGK